MSRTVTHYPAAYKLEVLNEVDATSLHSTAKRRELPTSTIRSWRNNRERIEAEAAVHSENLPAERADDAPAEAEEKSLTLQKAERLFELSGKEIERRLDNFATAQKIKDADLLRIFKEAHQIRALESGRPTSINETRKSLTPEEIADAFGSVFAAMGEAHRKATESQAAVEPPQADFEGTATEIEEQ